MKEFLQAERSSLQSPESPPPIHPSISSERKPGPGYASIQIHIPESQHVQVTIQADAEYLFSIVIYCGGAIPAMLFFDDTP